MKNDTSHSRPHCAALAMLLVCLLASLTGCASSTRAQMGLATQARKGVAMWATREEGRINEVTRQYTDRRRELDAAFDTDVRQRAATGAAIDAGWVIESRKAYAVGVEALTRAEAAAKQSAQTAKANAADTDALLVKLQSLQTARLGLETFIPALIFPNSDLLLSKGATDEQP